MPAVYEKIKNDGLNFPATITISNELRDLIEGMLEKDPNKRLTLPQIKVNLIDNRFAKTLGGFAKTYPPIHKKKIHSN